MEIGEHCRLAGITPEVVLNPKPVLDSVSNGLVYELRQLSNSAKQAAELIVNLSSEDSYSRCNFDSLRKKVEKVNKKVKDLKRRGSSDLSGYCQSTFEPPRFAADQSLDILPEREREVIAD